MRRFPRSLLLVACLSGAASVAGCGPEFDPFNRLGSLRVLAIKSDPPLPGPGETAALSALVFTPRPSAMGAMAAGDVPVSFSWSWCPLPGPANQGYPCQVSEADLQQLASAAGLVIPRYDLGTAATAQLPHALNPLVLAQLCQGVEGLPQSIDCEGGFPVQVMLKVKTPTDEVISVRTLRLRYDPEATANANPRIDGMTVRLPDTTADLAITDMPEVTLPRAKESLLKVAVPLELAEMYLGKDENMKPAMLREQLTLTWFVETGDTDEERTRYVEGGFRAEKTFENSWEPERRKDYAPDTSRVIVVIRDNRGGVDWRSAAVRLEATP